MATQQTLGGKPAKTDTYPEEEHKERLAELEAEIKANSGSAAEPETEDEANKHYAWEDEADIERKKRGKEDIEEDEEEEEEEPETGPQRKKKTGKGGCYICHEPLSSYGFPVIDGEERKVCITCENWKSRYEHGNMGTPVGDFKVGDKISVKYCRESLPARIYSIEVVKTPKGDMNHYFCYYEHHYCYDDDKDMVEDLSWFEEVEPRTEPAVLVDLDHKKGNEGEVADETDEEEPRKFGIVETTTLSSRILEWIAEKQQRPLVKLTDEKEKDAEPEELEDSPLIAAEEDDIEPEKKEAALETCPCCGKQAELETDVGFVSSSSCAACIRKKHKLEEGKPDFTIKGDTVRFYSATTGWVEHPLKDIARLFGSIIGNSVFPYSINIINGYAHKNGTKSLNCLGITKEFGEWLLSNPDLNFKKVVKESPIGDNEDYYATPAWDKYEQEEKPAKGDEPYKKSKLGKKPLASFGAEQAKPTPKTVKITVENAEYPAGFLEAHPHLIAGDSVAYNTDHYGNALACDTEDEVKQAIERAKEDITKHGDNPKVEDSRPAVKEAPKPPVVAKVPEGEKALILIVRKFYSEEFGGFPYTEVGEEGGQTYTCDTEGEVVKAIQTVKNDIAKRGKVPIVEDKRVKLVQEEAV